MFPIVAQEPIGSTGATSIRSHLQTFEPKSDDPNPTLNPVSVLCDGGSINATATALPPRYRKSTATASAGVFALLRQIPGGSVNGERSQRLALVNPLASTKVASGVHGCSVVFLEYRTRSNCSPDPS